jgi:hypothetical protein
MQVKVDINTIMTSCVLGMVLWIFTTVQRVDKQIALAGYRVDALAAQTFDPDCPYCNHALHGQINR